MPKSWCASTADRCSSSLRNTAPVRPLRTALVRVFVPIRGVPLVTCPAVGAERHPLNLTPYLLAFQLFTPHTFGALGHRAAFFDILAPVLTTAFPRSMVGTSDPAGWTAHPTGSPSELTGSHSDLIGSHSDPTGLHSDRIGFTSDLTGFTFDPKGFTSDPTRSASDPSRSGSYTARSASDPTVLHSNPTGSGPHRAATDSHHGPQDMHNIYNAFITNLLKTGNHEKSAL